MNKNFKIGDLVWIMNYNLNIPYGYPCQYYIDDISKDIAELSDGTPFDNSFNIKLSKCYKTKKELLESLLKT